MGHVRVEGLGPGVLAVVCEGLRVDASVWPDVAVSCSFQPGSCKVLGLC